MKVLCLSKVVLFISLLSLTLSCSNHIALEEENKELRDSLKLLKTEVKRHNYLWSFESVKPMLIPADSNFYQGQESKFELVLAAMDLERKQKPYALNLEVSSSLKNFLKLEKAEKRTNLLFYKPSTLGRDTISAVFYFQDPDSIQSFSFPVKSL